MHNTRSVILHAQNYVRLYQYKKNMLLIPIQYFDTSYPVPILHSLADTADIRYHEPIS